jgi:hypothetical protein
VTDWDPRPIEDIDAEAETAASTAAIDAATGDVIVAPDPGDARAAVRRQLLLLGLFALCVVLLFAFAGTALAGGGGCGGG